MRENDKKKAARGGALAAFETTNGTEDSSNKINRVRTELTAPGGLNRFEAERIGDHCLNSTVAALRKRGDAILDVWETVPTRYSEKGVRVKRYRLIERLSA